MISKPQVSTPTTSVKPAVVPASPVVSIGDEKLESCLRFTWRQDEDGQALHITPHDHGGATNYGITIAVYQAWRVKHGHPNPSITDLANAPKAELEQLIQEDYWTPVRGEELPRGVDLLVYDFGFGSGSSTSIRQLQAVLGLVQDGQFGPQTMAAVQAKERINLIKALAARHDAFYRSLAQYSEFGRGWSRRNADRLALALAM